MSTLSFKIINGITIYRIIAAPVLLFFAFTGNENLFKWLLPISFLTDLVDGYLARKFKVISSLGSLLDSIGDDLTVLVAMIGMFAFRLNFVKDERIIFLILFVLFVIQTSYAVYRYRKITSYHTYLAKIAAVLQGIFFICIFLWPHPYYALFYAAAIITALDLVEEIWLIYLLPAWEADIHGVFWVLKKRKINKT